MSDIAPTSTTRRQRALACEECRARKLRCDMGEPQCSTCASLGITCIVNTDRRPRGPRKGHVKILKSRISTLERQLSERAEAQVERKKELEATEPLNLEFGGNEFPSWPSPVHAVDLDSEWRQIEALPDSAYFSSTMSPPDMQLGIPPLELDPPAAPLLAGPSPVQLSALECADLDDIFFARAYTLAPVVHQQRYYARAARPDTGEPFACLQHAMRALAASMSSQFKGILPLLCGHAQGILSAWEQRVPDEAMPFELVQARLLLAMYEILQTNPRKGWISAGRCFHLVHLVKLDDIDNPKAWKTSTLSWVEIEERRRTFWAAYALERFANLVNGLPLTLNHYMILTRLPAPEAAFQRQQPVKTEFLPTAMARINEQQLSPYAKSIVIITILARCICHRNQCKVERIMDPSSEECLARHRKLDTVVEQGLGLVTALDTESDHLFIEMLAQCTVLVLFSALRSVPDDTTTYLGVCTEYEKKASQATDRIHELAQNIPQLGCFRVNPFTPIALFLCGDYMRSPLTMNGNPTNAAQFKTTCACLRHLAPANNLAQMLEFKLQQSPDAANQPNAYA
ncbi:hypothetical protein BDV18DRAFT_166565 [Aspergillus unguis]